jgi:hypothetical protein
MHFLFFLAIGELAGERREGSMHDGCGVGNGYGVRNINYIK